MPELKWTRDRTYFDGQRGFRAEGPGVYDVPEEAVEEYLNHRSGGWERVDEEASETEEESANEPEPDSEPETEPSTEEDDEPDSDDGESEADGDDDGDAGEVTPSEIAESDDWRWAKETIESGALDDALDEVEDAEKARENGPRDSVLGAIEDRREA